MLTVVGTQVFTHQIGDLMKRKDVRFDAGELKESLGQLLDYARGKIGAKVRVSHIALPQPAVALTSGQVRNIRAKLNLSQAAFARVLNVELITVRSWEKGRRNPGGPALRLLQVAEQSPGALLSIGGKSGDLAKAM